MAATESLITVLQKTGSNVNNELVAAQRFLEEAARADLPGLLKNLSDILANVQCDPIVRMQAGLQLKNAIYSKDPTARASYHARWLQFPLEYTNYIKQKCFEALGTETTVHSSAAQCIAHIACAEVPAMRWPDLMSKLVANVTNPTSTESVKHATLEAIGYICQDIDPFILSNQSSEILTAIIFGMKKEEPSDLVKLAATNALLNSLEFTKHHFDVEHERNYIMQVVCESTQSPDPLIKVAALQCLVKIMSLYYSYMEMYMGQALFAITLNAMKSDIPEVSLQGIEFWSTVSDEELELAIEASECAEKGQPPTVSSKFYAKGALQYIVPILMEILAKQDEGDDDDEWNPSKAAGVCIMLLAQACEDAIVDIVIPFVRQHIENPNWKYRDAAVMSFGSILEGPNPTALKPLVVSAMPVIINMLGDQSPAVRDTTAWTLGRVCEVLPEVALSDDYLRPLLQGLLEGLQSEPRVAANVCWAFSNLADSAYEVASNESNEQESTDPPTYALSPYFKVINERLLAVSERPDGAQHNLRNAAYSALMALMRSAAKDCYEEVKRVTGIVLERLNFVMGLEGQVISSQDRAQFNDLQSLLCATLQSVLGKINKEDAPALAGPIMSALMTMLASTSAAKISDGAGDQAGEAKDAAASTLSTGVQEDALLAMSALLDVLGEGFLPYLEPVMPVVYRCLYLCVETQVCVNAIGLLSDLCRVLGKHLAPHCDILVQILMEVLQNSEADKSIRPAILSAFGDISLALGNGFAKYLPVVMETLKQATRAEVDLNDPDMVEYLNSLWSSCLEAYTGIIQGMKDGENGQSSPQMQFIAGHVSFIVAFIQRVGNDSINTEDIISSSCGLIGDLVSAFGAQILPIVDVEQVQNVLTLGRRSKNSRTRSVANWATKEIKKLQNATKAAGLDSNQFTVAGANASGASRVTAGGSSAGTMRS
ncbi:unnamed protein product [Mesocestoides corti]|uniref:Importin N-terminal domain-containing protein n=1 Tax=Mesocestoides corti TaxID=53468 RepID=A0A0R3UFS5_MESCO|nr:unnamed protein product [Mesocestoides corti]